MFSNHQNVFDYIVERGISTQKVKYLSPVKLKTAKNYNLLVTLPDGRQLLVKQERHYQNGKSAGKFLREWQIHNFIKQPPEVNHIRPLLSEVINYNANDSIIIFNYLKDYCDLAEFYTHKNVFLPEIATEIGSTLATIHRATFDRQKYRDFFCQNCEGIPVSFVPNFIHGLERIGPEVFGLVPADGLKFFMLYQRYDSLGQAIAELANTFKPCCLTHNDLKLNNILLHNHWEQDLSEKPSSNSIVRLIDWERCAWGDPAFDLGTLIASYLQIWLSSLVVSKTIAIEESLRLAMTPLEQLQPSIAALTGAYLKNFPQIAERYPQFLRRVVQYSGLALIQQIQAMIQYEKAFGNAGICMLQVAKSLLCRPEQSISTVFGTTESELTCLISFPT